MGDRRASHACRPEPEREAATRSTRRTSRSLRTSGKLVEGALMECTLARAYVRALGVSVSVALLVSGCAGPSRYVIIRIPTPAASVRPTDSRPPHDDSDIVPKAW